MAFLERLGCLTPAIPSLFLVIAMGSSWGETPSLDPLLFYRESTIFFSDGFNELYRTTHTAHPPLLHLAMAALFHLFGKSPAAYNLAGLLCLASSSSLLFVLTQRCFSRCAATVLTLLLFCNPLAMSNFFYPTHETFLLTAVIFVLYFYVTDRKLAFSASLSLLVLIKQTALVALIAFFCASVIEHIKARRAGRSLRPWPRSLLVPFVPAGIVFCGWLVYLYGHGGTEWRGDLLGAVAGQNTYLVLLKALTDPKVVKVFLLQNLGNVVVLNFQWLYVFLIVAFLPQSRLLSHFETAEGARYLTFVFLFTALYIVFVLSIPTWTIPRYALPTYLGLFLLLALALAQLRSRMLLFSLFGCCAVTTVLGNFVSIDSASARAGYRVVHGETFYATQEPNAGEDRLNYNLQFVRAVRSQNRLIGEAITREADAIVADCLELKLGEKLEALVLHNDFYPALHMRKPIRCLGPDDLENSSVREWIRNKVVFVPSSSTPRVEPAAR